MKCDSEVVAEQLISWNGVFGVMTGVLYTTHRIILPMRRGLSIA